MDLEKIKALMEAMEDKGMTKVVLKEESGFEIELQRGSDFEAVPYHAISQMAKMPSIEPAPLQVFAEKEKVEAIGTKEGHHLTSPMVGTYYSTPSPEDGPFVKVGDAVTAETVVCIIEAMKVMNEVKAGKSGVVEAIHINNADPVEFGTKILTISES